MKGVEVVKRVVKIGLLNSMMNVCMYFCCNIKCWCTDAMLVMESGAGGCRTAANNMNGNIILLYYSIKCKMKYIFCLFLINISPVRYKTNKGRQTERDGPHSTPFCSFRIANRIFFVFIFHYHNGPSTYCFPETCTSTDFNLKGYTRP